LCKGIQHQGTIDRIACLLKKKNIRTIFAPPNNLRKFLSVVKDPISPRSHKGVYQILYTCGKTYIGETGRTINTRIKEHKADITHRRVKKSALAEHAHKTKHHIMIEDANVLARVDHWSKRRIREATEISENPNCLNRDDGLILSRTWLPSFYNS
jgi:hypothetical protein